jgi:dimethylglycine dehydrogenase
MRPDKTWDVVTTHGTIHAQSVVNAAGLWAREVAVKAGITLPLLPVEHHYLVTEAIAEIESLGFELPLIGDADSEYYMRQEGLGLLLGVYEDTCTHWAEDGTPPDFGHELLPNHLDRIERNLAQAMERVPVLAQVGIKRVINGPMIFSPDLNPLIGPYPGVPNYWCACGVMTGFSQSAAIGMVLAGWMTEREPPLDVFMWDVARYGSWAGKDYVRARTGDMYATRFKTLYPYEHRDAGRPTRTTDAYALQARRGAIFGANDGLEYPLWFARPGIEPRETLTFRRPNWFGPVGEECRALHASVAATDISTYGKHRVTGPGAFAWLQKIMANDMAEHDGDVVATPMLSHGGRLVGDFAVARLSAQDFVLIGSGEASRIHHRWWAQFLPCEGVSIESLTTSFGGMAVQGPRSREVMEALCRCDFSKEAWPEHRAAICKTGPVVNAILFSSSFTGETGFDVFVPRQTLLSLLEAILSTGMEFELSLAGARAMNSLRIEAGRGAWGTEYTPDFTPFEAGLNHLISGRKTGFVGCAAAMRDRHAPRYVLRRFEIDADDVDPWGDEPILNGEEVVGFLTSAAYGYRTSKSLALGYILPEKAEQTERLSIDILGDRRRIMVRNADTAGQARSVALGSIPAPLA